MLPGGLPSAGMLKITVLIWKASVVRQCREREKGRKSMREGDQIRVNGWEKKQEKGKGE